MKGEEGSGDLESAGVSHLNKGKGSQRSQRQRLAHLLAQVSLAQAGAAGTGLEEPSGPGLVRGVTRECLLRGRVCGSGGNRGSQQGLCNARDRPEHLRVPADEQETWHLVQSLPFLN